MMALGASFSISGVFWAWFGLVWFGQFGLAVTFAILMLM
jgi:hypothetical protein